MGREARQLCFQADLILIFTLTPVAGMNYLFCLVLFFETRCYGSPAVLKFAVLSVWVELGVIILLLFPKYWGFRLAPPHPVCSF